MANPFDEFDEVTPAKGANPFDEFDISEDVKQEAAIRREMAMKPEEYDAYIREKVRAGGFYRPQPSKATLLGDQGTDVVGLQDEIAGAGQFLRRLVTSGGSLGEAGKAYSDAADRIRAERRVSRDENGWLGTAAEVAGGLGSGGVAKAGTLAKGFWETGKQAAKAGAASGGAVGFAQGEDGLVNRLRSMGTGALIGGTVAPALTNVAIPLAARGVGVAKDAWRYGNQARRSYLNPEQVAVENVADRMVASGLDPSVARSAVSPPPSANLASRGFTDADMADVISRQMSSESADSVARSYAHRVNAQGQKPTAKTMAAYLRKYQEQNPTPLNLIDIAKEVQGEGASGPMWRLGRAAHGLSGDESADAAQALMSRQETQPGRASGIARQAVGGKDYETTLLAGRQKLQKEAGEAYRDFYKQPDLGTDQLDDLFEDPLFRQAVTNARDQARVDTIARNQELAKAGKPLEPVPYSAKNDPQIARLQKELQETQDNLREARRRRQDATSKEEKRAALEESRQHEDTVTAIQREIHELSHANEEVFSPQMLDYIQRKLRLASEGKVSDPTAAKHAGDLRKVFLDRIEKHYPTFRGIRQKYAEGMGEFGEDGALQAGREMTRRLGERTDEALRDFDQATPAQQDLQRLGFARQLMDDAANTQIGGAVANKFRTGATEEIVRRMWSGDAKLKAQGEALLRNLKREAITTKTKNDVLSGARTAEYEGDMGRLMEGAKAAADVATLNFRGILQNLSTRLTTQLGQRGATETMKILTTTDPAKLLPLLNRLEQAAKNTQQRRALVTSLRELRAANLPGIGVPVGNILAPDQNQSDQRR